MRLPKWLAMRIALFGKTGPERTKARRSVAARYAKRKPKAVA